MIFAGITISPSSLGVRGSYLGTVLDIHFTFGKQTFFFETSFFFPTQTVAKSAKIHIFDQNLIKT